MKRFELDVGRTAVAVVELPSGNSNVFTHFGKPPQFESLPVLRQALSALTGDPFFSDLASERRYRELMARLRLAVQS
jgi:hypothetical protein